MIYSVCCHLTHCNVFTKFTVYDHFLVVFFSTSINGQDLSSVCNDAVNQGEDDENKWYILT